MFDNPSADCKDFSAHMPEPASPLQLQECRVVVRPHEQRNSVHDRFPAVGRDRQTSHDADTVME